MSPTPTPLPSDAADPRALAARLMAMEELVTHVQRAVEDIHHVVLAQQKQLDQCEGRIKRLEGDVQSVARSLPDRRDPEEERPPHY